MTFWKRVWWKKKWWFGCLERALILRWTLFLRWWIVCEALIIAVMIFRKQGTVKTSQAKGGGDWFTCFEWNSISYAAQTLFIESFLCKAEDSHFVSCRVNSSSRSNLMKSSSTWRASQFPQNIQTGAHTLVHLFSLCYANCLWNTNLSHSAVKKNLPNLLILHILIHERSNHNSI